MDRAPVLEVRLAFVDVHAHKRALVRSTVPRCNKADDHRVIERGICVLRLPRQLQQFSILIAGLVSKTEEHDV